MTCICHFIYFRALPRASYWYIWFGFIPSMVWRFFNDFPIALGVGKIVLHRENFLHTCVRCNHRILAYWPGIWRDSVSVCMSVHSSVYSDSISMSVSTFVYPSVHSYIHWFVYRSVNTILGNIVSPHPCQIAWKTISHLIWYLGIPDVRFFIYRLDISLEMYVKTCQMMHLSV